MKLIALKELPQGTQPGEAFEANEDIGNVLILVGAARKATRADAPGGPAHESMDPSTDDPAKPASRRYQRRDLQSEK